jgi:catechol 2,3-dioxygenase-like lactoylglutathione lyase family enzyme
MAESGIGTLRIPSPHRGGSSGPVRLPAIGQPSGLPALPDLGPRVGLDHLSFSVASRRDLAEAVRLFEEHQVRHGQITSLASFGIDVLPFEDPDGVQLELTAPMAQPGG